MACHTSKHYKSNNENMAFIRKENFANEEQFLGAWETMGTDALWDRYGNIDGWL